MATSDFDAYQAHKFTPESYEPPRQRGCFFYGCIFAIVLMVVIVIALATGAYFLYRTFGRLVEEYTATAPQQLPTVEMPAEQRQVLRDRIAAFRKAVSEGAPTEPLVLTSDDLNALIEQEPELKGKIYVKIEGDEVKGTVSIPLDQLNVSMVKGRYLNGEADLKASLRDGVLIVTLESIEVNGQRVPDQMMDGIRRENLAKDAYKDEKSAEMMRKLESLEIKDGKIILKVRAKPGAASGEPSSKKATPVEIVPPGSAQPKSEPSKPEPSKTKNGQPDRKAAA